MISDIVDEVRDTVKHDYYWQSRFHKIKNNHNLPFGIHLAIFVEPYLKFILDGKKTVESRFSLKRIAPYQKAHKGDIVLLKQSGGPVVGLCEISSVWFYDLDPKSWKYIKKEFTVSLCAQDPEFWSKRKHASYATLMKVKRATSIGPINLVKQDRRGWIVLHEGNNHNQQKN